MFVFKKKKKQTLSEYRQSYMYNYNIVRFDMQKDLESNNY